MIFLKILAVFPEIVSRGGSERGLAFLAEHFKMDILTNRYEPEKTFEEFKKVNIIEWGLPSRLAFGLKLAATKFSGYDLFLSYGYFITNFIAIKNHPAVWYCHTPYRYFYEPFRSLALGEIKNPVKKFLKSNFSLMATGIDKFLVGKVDKIACNSENIQRRIRQIYNRDAAVTYGPVDMEKFKYKREKEFYLCAGRIEKVKRVKLVVRAFGKMPDKKLIIAGSSKDEKYLNYLKSIAGRNVKFFENVSDNNLRNFYSACIAVIYMPMLEDFGLVPIEAMASGKPCIGADEGGLRETIVHEKTGLLIEASEENLIRAVKFLTPERAAKMRPACIDRAKLFSKEKFIERMGAFFGEAISSAKG